MNTTLHRKPSRDPWLIEGVLANLPLMKGVSRNIVRELATQSRLITAKRGEFVVRRGERVPGFFALAYGSVKKRLPRSHSGESVLALLKAGETFAEVPALLGQASKFDLVALADCMVVIVNAACISAQAQRDPRLAHNIMHILARRLEAFMSELERGALPALMRVALYVESIAEPDGVARLQVSKTLLAARLDIKKETLSRLLRELAVRGLIVVEGREIRLLDRTGLAALTR